MRLKKGDRVRVASHSMWRKYIGLEGTVMRDDAEGSNIPVQFGKRVVDGHSCADLCKCGYGRWFARKDLVKIRGATTFPLLSEGKIISPREQNSIQWEVDKL